MKEKFEEFWKEPKHKVLVLILVVLLAYLSVEGLLNKNVEVVNVGQNNSIATGAKSQNKLASTTMHEVDMQKTNLQEVTDNTKVPKRNPFEVPAAYREVKPMLSPEGKSGAPLNEQVSNPAPVNHEKPIAKGLIGTSDQSIAILEYNKERKQCMVGEYIGPYKVAGMYSDLVTLEGPEGTISLKVGQ